MSEQKKVEFIPNPDLTRLEVTFNELITLFRKLEEEGHEAAYALDKSYGIIDTTIKNADFESVLPLYFEDITFLIGDFFNSAQGETNYLIEIHEPDKEPKRIPFKNHERATTFVKEFIPIQKEEEDVFDYVEIEDYKGCINAYVDMALSSIIKRENFQKAVTDYGIDVSAYRGFNSIYSLQLHDEDFFDIRMKNEIDFTLSISTSSGVTHVETCRGDTIMQKSKEIIENYLN